MTWKIFVTLVTIGVTQIGCRDYEKSYAQDGAREFKLACAPADCEFRAGQLCKKRGFQIFDHRDSEGNITVVCGKWRRR
jgi:hypothetical protein